MLRGLARVIDELRRRESSEQLGAATLPGGADTLGGLRPTMGPLTLEEAAWMLQGLFLVNKSQLRHGQAGIDSGLRSGRVRYIRRDPQERWKKISEIWLDGGGDCEDLAAAEAARIDERLGVQARPVIYRVRPGLAHAVVEILDPRYRRIRGGTLFGHPVITQNARGRLLVDPSRTGGMGRA